MGSGLYYAHKDDTAAQLVNAVLTNTQMWDQDLTKIEGLEAAVLADLEMIRTQGAEAAYKDACKPDRLKRNIALRCEPSQSASRPAPPRGGAFAETWKRKVFIAKTSPFGRGGIAWR